MKTIIIKSVFLASFFVFASNDSAFSQSCNHTTGGNSNDLHGKLDIHRPNEVQAPIDGGLGLLILAGVVYGIKRASVKRKRLNESRSAESIY